MFYQPQRMRFGAFVAPFHGLSEDPTLTIERDMRLGVVLDELGYDEYWIGEHHSAGVENIGSPELMIAALAERTKHIRLGTGVNSLTYHHPLVIADRLCQLDHQTRGRIMFGAGPGQIPSDAFMMGISPTEQRRMLVEALDVIVPLLHGETVTRTTDWFKLIEGRLHMLPYQSPTMEYCVASAVTPSGPSLAGKLGAGMLSVASSSKEGFAALADAWQVCEQAAAAHDRQVHRDRWRVVVSMHIAPTREQAMAEAEWGIMDLVHYFRKMLGNHAAGQPFWQISNAREALELWTTEGLGAAGIAVIGTPDDALAQVRRMQEQSGGFGCLLISTQNSAEFQATCRSFEYFARYCRPVLNASNRNRVASLEWAHENSERFVNRLLEGMQKAFDEHGTDARDAIGWAGAVAEKS